MAKPATAGGASSLPEEIIVWEILVCLPPESLLRCRTVCRAWRRATSTRGFLLAHHARQPVLPIVSGYDYRGDNYNLHALDHRASAGARLQPVAQLGDSCPEASCDGLLILSSSERGVAGPCLSVCNPATRQHAPLRQLSGLSFSLLGMYRHRPTGEHRLLLHRAIADLPPKDQTGCHVFTLGSDQPPRYVGWLEELAAPTELYVPALLRDSLHWYPAHGRTRSKLVIVFDTASESFRHMRAPAVPAKSYIFEMDATLGIYNHNLNKRTVDIWVLRNYDTEVWAHEYHVELPAEDMKGKFGIFMDNSWVVTVVSADGDILLLVNHAGWMFCVHSDGKLVDNFHRDGQILYDCELRLKQTLVPHNFFTTLECYAVNPSPSI